MTTNRSQPSARRGRKCLGLLLAGGGLASVLAGCDADSYFDPSVQGYWEAQPTTLPILSQLDTIESGEDGWGQVTDPTPEDLVPSDLSYEFAPGDFVTVQVFELYAQGQWAATTRRIDPGGFLRVQEIGDVQAAGLTPQELQDVLTEAYSEMITLPQVDVVLEQGSGFQYTVYGRVAGQGLYTLNDPDLRLIDALAAAGGIPEGVDEVFVIRTVELSESVRPSFERESPVERPESGEGVDIDDLIDRFDEPSGGGMNPGAFSASYGGYGVMGQEGEPAIDVEDLEPAVRRPAGGPDVGDGTPVRSGAWVYDEQRGEWVRTSPDPAAAGTPGGGAGGEPPLFVERVIRIPVDALNRGRAEFNVVIRPDDRIYVAPPLNGIVYLEGEVSRPGPYNIPANSTYTLSRLIAAAGGLGALAIPERVDITRMVGTDREATITVNFAAIRHRTEPDILLKPDDHVNVGTSFWATPLAVIRNGFRATYGFGFLLDRNFGNDVFGAPPSNVGRGG